LARDTKVSDLPRGTRIAPLQDEEETIMTRLEHKDRKKPAPGSKPGSKLDKRTSDAMDEIEGPAERDGRSGTDKLEEIEEAEKDPAKNVPSA
jgi:hypothetical protein